MERERKRERDQKVTINAKSTQSRRNIARTAKQSQVPSSTVKKKIIHYIMAIDGSDPIGSGVYGSKLSLATV